MGARAFYAILRANAVVVPVNPMNRTDELRHYRRRLPGRHRLRRAGSAAADAATAARRRRGPGHRRRHLQRHLEQPTDLPCRLRRRRPRLLRCPRCDAVERRAGARPATRRDDGRPRRTCVMPHTLGHHRRQGLRAHAPQRDEHAGGRPVWFSRNQDAVFLSSLPFFHVTGLSGSMNGPMCGCHDRGAAALDHEAAAVVHPALRRHHLADDHRDAGRLRPAPAGGPRPVEPAGHPRRRCRDAEAVARRSRNSWACPTSKAMACRRRWPPPTSTRRSVQAAVPGRPVFDVDARVVDPDTLRELPPGESGEIVVHGPQVMRATGTTPRPPASSFVELDGKAFPAHRRPRLRRRRRLFLHDRPSQTDDQCVGLQVWPAEVEALMYRHPTIQEACVIAAADARRGETVKALVVLKPDTSSPSSRSSTGPTSHMAAFTRARASCRSCLPAQVRFGQGDVARAAGARKPQQPKGPMRPTPKIPNEPHLSPPHAAGRWCRGAAGAAGRARPEPSRASRSR